MHHPKTNGARNCKSSHKIRINRSRWLGKANSISVELVSDISDRFIRKFTLQNCLCLGRARWRIIDPHLKCDKRNYLCRSGRRKTKKSCYSDHIEPQPCIKGDFHSEISSRPGCKYEVKTTHRIPGRGGLWKENFGRCTTSNWYSYNNIFNYKFAALY